VPVKLLVIEKDAVPPAPTVSLLSLLNFSMVQLGNAVQLSTGAALAPRRRKRGAINDNSMSGGVVDDFDVSLDVGWGRPFTALQVMGQDNLLLSYISELNTRTVQWRFVNRYHGRYG